MSAETVLSRKLGLFDAVAIGLGAMVGAGVFVVFAPAAAAAGSALLVGLALAAIVAFSNATSSAQLAAVYPTSGGTYIYGREQLGQWWGFAAGWNFLVGKTASCAAMALTFAAYVVPHEWLKPTAIAAVVLLTGINLLGVTRTALVAKAIVSVVGIVLIVLLVMGFSAGAGPVAISEISSFGSADWFGVLQSAGLLFFAFAGYARIATLGEEVRNPRTIIPQAIVISLVVTIVLYAVLAVVLLGVLGSVGLSQASAPLVSLAQNIGVEWFVPVVGVAAALASLGALLALITGVSRTGLAMARYSDIPHWFAVIHPRYEVPYRVEVGVAVAVCSIILLFDVRGAIGFSSFGVLLYYFVANLAAFTQEKGQRRYPKVFQIVGMVLCVVLVITLPFSSVLAGMVLLVFGVVYRWLRLRVGRSG